eukprot:6825796-Pyramimonas_sp.AAC.1
MCLSSLGGFAARALSCYIHLRARVYEDRISTVLQKRPARLLMCTVSAMPAALSGGFPRVVLALGLPAAI